MKLILIRHGESAHNRGYKVASSENNLTPIGVQQAIRLGAELKNTKIDVIYCSPALRCEQTLDEILRIRNDDMGIHLTNLIGPKLKQENFEKLKARIGLFLDDLKYDHKENETVVIVSHLLPIEMMTYLIIKDKRRLENGEKLVLSIK